MATTKNFRRNEQGSTLVACMVLALVLCSVISSFMSVLLQEYRITHRSHNFATAINLAEAGVEEAMGMINYGQSNWTGYGWTAVGTNYAKTVGSVTPLGSAESVGLFAVTVYGPTNDNPVVFSSASTLADYTGDPITRTVRAQLARRPIFQWGLLAENTVNLNGNDLTIDSFDSSDPDHSNWDPSKGHGTYDPATHKDNGDIASNAGIANTIAGGNADIYGHVATGPGGTVSIGPNGFVGTTDYHPDGVVQEDRVGHSMSVDLPTLTSPFAGGINKGDINGSDTLSGGNGSPVDYLASSIFLSNSETLRFTSGYSRVHVTGNLHVTGNATIIVDDGAKVEFYVDGSVNIAGNGIVNNNNKADTFQLYVSGSVTVSVSGNGQFVGVIYAPNSDVSLSGGGTGGTIVGSVVGNSITLDGHLDFHYDEALRKDGPTRGWSVVAWEER